MGDRCTVHQKEEWYEQYYHKKSACRNDPVRNPEVLVQTSASDASVLAVPRSALADPAAGQVVDLAGAGGAS